MRLADLSKPLEAYAQDITARGAPSLALSAALALMRANGERSAAELAKALAATGAQAEGPSAQQAAAEIRSTAKLFEAAGAKKTLLSALERVAAGFEALGPAPIAGLELRAEAGLAPTNAPPQVLEHIEALRAAQRSPEALKAALEAVRAAELTAAQWREMAKTLAGRPARNKAEAEKALQDWAARRTQWKSIRGQIEQAHKDGY